MKGREELVESHCCVLSLLASCNAPTAACQLALGKLAGGQGTLHFLNVQCAAWIYRNVTCSSNGLAHFVRPREFVKENVWCIAVDFDCQAPRKAEICNSNHI